MLLLLVLICRQHCLDVQHPIDEHYCLFEFRFYCFQKRQIILRITQFIAFDIISNYILYVLITF